MNWPAHPDDEWVDITQFGDPEPRYILARSGVEKEIAKARTAYVDGQISAEEFEARIAAFVKDSAA